MILPYQFKAQDVIDDGRCDEKSIQEIKFWLSSTDLPELPEELIVLFLLSCNNDKQTTRDTIEAYFRIKNEAPEMFNQRDIDQDDLKKGVQTAYMSSIPARMDDNTVIHFFKLKDTNYQNFDLIPLMKLAYMLIDISQRYNPPNKLVVLLDMKGVGFMHLTRVKIGALKKFFEFLQEAMPLRIHMIYILNTNYIFDKIIALARAFIKSELMAILKTYPPDMDMDEFYKDCIPARCLPKEYGGELPTFEELNQKSIEQFRELKPFFEAEEKLRNCMRNKY